MKYTQSERMIISGGIIGNYEILETNAHTTQETG